MRYVTRLKRFERGDYPMICVRTGLPADRLVKVRARRIAKWPSFFLGSGFIPFLSTLASVDGDGPVWGLLPVSDDRETTVNITFDAKIGVILRGVHPDFVTATKAARVAH